LGVVFCYITEDFAKDASLKGFSIQAFLSQEKQYYLENDKKTLDFVITLIFYHRAVLKLDYYMTLFVELCKHRFVMQPL
jgi:hypothetical protein